MPDWLKISSEEHPEKWKEIHDAYEIALQLAERGQGQNESDSERHSACSIAKIDTTEQPENTEKPPVPIAKNDTTQWQKRINRHPIHRK